MAVHKFSRQRECIREYLRSRKDHPTADMIFTAVKEQYPSISLGTVYRNLNMMVTEGEIVKIDVGQGVEHYDACTSPHYHFYCASCNQVSDIEIAPIPELMQAVKAVDGNVDGYSLIFHGICRECSTCS